MSTGDTICPTCKQYQCVCGQVMQTIAAAVRDEVEIRALRTALAAAEERVRELTQAHKNNLKRIEIRDKAYDNAHAAHLAAEERARVAEEELQVLDSILARRPALAECKTRAEMVELACYTAGKKSDEVTRLTAEVEEWKKEAKEHLDLAEYWKAQAQSEHEYVLLVLDNIRTLRRSSVRAQSLLDHRANLFARYRRRGWGFRDAQVQAIEDILALLAYITRRSTRKEEER